MDNRSYIGLLFLISCVYIYYAEVIQNHGEVAYFDKNYISEARAFTGRRSRNDRYLTNATVVTRVEVNNNVTVKVVADIKTVGSIIFYENKICESFKIPWVKQYINSYSNVTDCPAPPGRYKMYNLEIPPKNFPLPIPKGEGMLNIYFISTKNKHILFHGTMKVISN